MTAPRLLAGLALAGVLLAGFLLRSSMRGVPGAPTLPLEPERGASTPAASPALPSRVPSVPAPNAEPTHETSASPPPAVAAPTYAAPGTIEGRVTRAGQPVAEGEAWIRRSHFGLDSGPCLTEGPDLDSERVRVDADGLFRFHAAPGHHCVGLELDGARHARAFQVVDGQPNERWEIVLGASGFEGTVWTTDGLPAPDAAIRIGGGPPRGPQVQRLTSTGLDGSYRISGLEAGTYGLEVMLDPRRDGPRLPSVFSMELAEGEVRRLDFGSPLGTHAWTGSLASSSGAPLPYIAVLFLLKDTSSGALYSSFPAPDARVHFPLTPGTYVPALNMAAGPLELGAFTMGTQDLETELRLPGTWVDVAVRYEGSKGEPKTAMRSLHVRASPLGSSGALIHALPGQDGHWHLLAVEPGTYEVSALQGTTARAPRATFPLDVRAGEDVIRMEIEVGDP